MKYKLVKPNLSYKEKYFDFLNEFVTYNSDINGTGYMDRILEDKTYEECMEECLKREELEHSYEIDRAQSITYILVDEQDDICGSVNIRFNLRDELIDRGITHVGYGVRPTKRGNGLAKLMLYEGLKVLDSLDEKICLMDAADDNPASWKTIEALDGKLTKKEIDPSDDTLTRWYEIDVKSAIENNKDIYEDMMMDDEEEL